MCERPAPSLQHQDIIPLVYPVQSLHPPSPSCRTKSLVCLELSDQARLCLQHLFFSRVAAPQGIYSPCSLTMGLGIANSPLRSRDPVPATATARTLATRVYRPRKNQTSAQHSKGGNYPHPTAISGIHYKVTHTVSNMLIAGL